MRADEFLLDRIAQPVVDWLGRRWGIDHIKLGLRLAKIACTLKVMFGAISMSQHHAAGETFAGTLLGFLYFVVAIFYYMLGRQAAIWARRFRVNPNRAHLFFMRMLTLFLLIESTAVYFIPPVASRFLLLIGASLFLIGSFYLLSCQRPPPKEIRQPNRAPWLSLRAATAAAPQPG